MFASIFILCFSVAVLLYWGRHTCLTILRAGQYQEEAERVAEANRLEFRHVRQLLEQNPSSADYDGVRDSLKHDFLALTYLLRYAATLHVGKYTGEERLLIVDFHLMRALYRLTRGVSPAAARYALLEMSSILEYFAAVMNRRMTAFSARMIEA